MKKNRRYSLLDSGEGLKLEQVGPYRLIRPASQAVWKKQQHTSLWQEADATFIRSSEGNRWQWHHKPLPAEWEAEHAGLVFKVEPTDFGHLGLFPEHACLWPLLTKCLQAAEHQPRLLNLFAYTGGASLIAAQANSSVCHLDASKAAVAWARENARLNGLADVPIRWIVDDVHKFLERELRRGKKYDAILLDPPTFGRGPKGELFKIEEKLVELLEHTQRLLSDSPLFFALTSHTAHFSARILANLLEQQVASKLHTGLLDQGELLLHSIYDNGLSLPCGSYAIWVHNS